MKNEDLYIYKKSDFYEDFISSQKEYYEREQVDKLLADKDREIALLKERICNGDVSRLTWIDDCIAKDKEIEELKQKLQDQCISCPVKMQEDDVVAELKKQLEDANELVKESKELVKESQKMHQRCADNASKQIRRLKRALYKACAEWALSTLSWLDCIDQGNPVKWGEMRRNCLEKVEEYK